jgi:glycosyltransferase involved in cell wall biosynthesis
MSIQKGNQLYKLGKFEEALQEYKSVERASPMFKQAQFNISLINKHFNAMYVPKEVHMPLVSVVMPVFNVAPYLDACILSVLNQTYQNLELIIVNDASTDNGLQIIRMYERLDNRIRVINLEFNTLGGAGIPSNIGVDNALGEYIAYADSDDILDKNAIHKMVEIALDTKVDLVIADFCNFNEETRAVEVSYDKAHWADLPLHKAFSVEDYPEVFRFSPVPWRKLYKTSFLNENKIRFPEGDYFYEDNPLHWFVLSKAENVALIDYVVAFHRMGREGQTMGANSFKLSAMICHVNTVNEFFNFHNWTISKTFRKELVDWSYRVGWIIEKQEEDKIKNIVKKRYSQLSETITDSSGLSVSEVLKLRPAFQKKYNEYKRAYSDKDLTIIIPVYNCADLLSETLDSLTKLDLPCEVFMIDDGSSDHSREICEKYASQHENFFCFSQNNRGAGVARNTVVPLATGEYTYFLDADDTVDVNSLTSAVFEARKNKNDLLLFKYKIHFYEKNNYREMWDADKVVWDKLLKAQTNSQKQTLAAGLVNYPWNRIIKTNLLHSEAIFFGKTVVHNDIPFHWHSIVAAKNIGIFDKAICNHRKFDEREQITNINDKRRMMVLEAFRHTNQLIKKYEQHNEIFPVWKDFVENLFNWAESRIPTELKSEYSLKCLNALNSINLIDSQNILSIRQASGE